MKEYVVIYEWTGNNYSAYAPDLPGCIACAATLDETEALMKKAMELYVHALREEHQAVPEPLTKAKLVSVAA